MSRLVTKGRHSVGGVAGLQLEIAPSGARSWILRVVVAGKRRDMGLGGFPDVTLARAREKAREARDKIAAGVDPIEYGRAARSALAASTAAAWTFSQCAAAFIAAKSPEWKNAKHAAQWTSTLATYAEPVVGGMFVRDVGLPQVLAILEPIWLTKTETATRVRSRLELVLDWAATRGYRHGLNPARWKGHLDNLLPKPSKVMKVKHHAALPATELGAFMSDLRALEGTGARALEFAILTATRSGETRGARWDEIDLDAGTWTIPAERMKMGREHRVPLAGPALALLRALSRHEGLEHVFRSPLGGQLSDMTLTAVTRRMKVNAVPHGFRATFKTWASESTTFPREVIEMALAHAIENKVEEAYQRGDVFAKRAKLMQAWAEFCCKTPAAAVLPLRRNATPGREL